MNAAMIIGSVIMERKLMKNRNWMISALAALITSTCVFIYGDKVSVFANFISLLMMSAYSMNPRNSVLVSVFQSFCSVSVSFAFMITDGIERKQKRIAEGKSNGRGWKKFWIGMIAFAVLLVFFSIYRQSNVLFDDLARHIDLSFISPAWIGFTTVGALLLYGYYYHHSIEQLSAWDAGISGHVVRSEKDSWLDSLLSISSEKFAGVLLLSLLNFLLLVVNFLDVKFIFGGMATLPAGVTFSEYVHQGVGMVIVSIIMAMCIILYFFRGRMNFETGNSALKNLALLWIAQNAVMIISACWRNNLYIDSYGLTYKRIGVYVYLVLALFGVLSIAWKVLGQRSNMFLFRINSWFAFCMLVASCTVNWDLFITRYNLGLKTPFDVTYFSSLSEKNFIPVLDHLYKHPEKFPAARFNERLYFFLERERRLQAHDKWPSTVLNSGSLYASLLNREAVPLGWNQDLDMSGTDLHELVYFPLFSNTSSLLVKDCELQNLGEIGKFGKVRRLEATKNPLTSIAGIENLTYLEYLSFDARSVKDMDRLLLCKNLKEVKIDGLSDGMRSALKAHFPGIVINESGFFDWL
jgi:hypothetical protein